MGLKSPSAGVGNVVIAGSVSAGLTGTDETIARSFFLGFSFLLSFSFFL